MIDWCRKRNISPSRMLIPVSYFAILGGVCTLVGTSTTIVANTVLVSKHREAVSDLVIIQADIDNADPSDTDRIAELQSDRDEQAAFVHQVRPMSLFEIGRVGLPCAIIGALVLIGIGPRLMPNRRDIVERHDTNRREYLVEMLVQPECRLTNQTVENAGLRQLPGLFLIEINRGRELITPVNPKDTIRANDRLVFTGIVSTIVDLEKIPGLVPATETPLARPSRAGTQLTEVVVSPSCPLIGSTVRDGLFRQRYNAAIVAIHRNGVRLTHKIGDIELEAGDTLLLQTRTDFVSAYRHSRDFYLVGGVEGGGPRRHDRAIWAGILGLLLVAWLSIASFVPQEGPWIGFSSHATAALTIALVIIVTRCLPVSSARNAIDLPLLLTIAGAIGLGNAIDASGADDAIAGYLVDIVGNNSFLLLVILYVVAMIFTEMITNNAVATTLLPLAIATAWHGGYNPRPFIMAIVAAASLSFLTPIGYQTNLMIMGPGGYRPADFLRVGLPVSIAVAITALTVIPWVWQF